MTGAVPEGSHDPRDGADDLRSCLASYLAHQALPEWSGVTVVSLYRHAGGLSWETFVVEVAETGCPERRRRLVVKRPPLDGPLAPYEPDKEALLLRALADSAVPVAPLLAYTSEPVVAGRPVEVMEHVAGDVPDVRTIDRWPAWRDTGRRRTVSRRLLGVLAALRGFDWRQPSLSAVLRVDRSPSEQVGDVIDRLMAKIEENVAPRWGASPVARDAWMWLRDNVPEMHPDDAILVHGDFRIGNLVWRDDRVVAVLDWERAGLGDPMVDLAFLCMPMARHRRPELMGMLMTAEDMVTGYEEETGQPVDLRRLHYYLVYWQYVELAQILNAIAYQIDRAPVDDLTSLTSYPLISTGTVELVDLIERFEDGEHDIR